MRCTFKATFVEVEFPPGLFIAAGYLYFPLEAGKILLLFGFGTGWFLTGGGDGQYPAKYFRKVYASLLWLQREVKELKKYKWLIHLFAFYFKKSNKWFGYDNASRVTAELSSYSNISRIFLTHALLPADC